MPTLRGQMVGGTDLGAGLGHSTSDDDQILAELHSLPMFQVPAGLVALAIAAISALGGLVIDDGDDRLNAAVVLFTALAWALRAVGVGLGPRLFACMVLAPTAALVALRGLSDWGWWDGPAVVGLGVWASLFLVVLMLFDFVFAPRRQLALVTAAAYVVVLGRGILDRSAFGTLLWAVVLTSSALAVAGVRLGAVAIAKAEQAIADQAAADDRRRMARDVHDVVAHTLAVMMLHLTAARMAVLRSSSQEAEEALEEAERHGRTSLVDVRRMVGLLRGAEDSSLTERQPGIADLRGLVDGYRGAGLQVELTVAGATEQVTGGAGVAVYRVVQEALANAARHGRGAAVVELRVLENEVWLDVRNPFRAEAEINPHGSGLLGMRERVAAVGGTVEHNQENGTWLVRARVRLNGASGVSG